MKKITSKDNNASLISSILFLILGCILLSDPNGVVKFLTYIVGAIFMLVGISRIVIYHNDKTKLNIITNNLTYGIIAIAIGIIMMFCNSIIEQVIRLVMGGFIIYTGIINMVLALNLKSTRFNNWITFLIIAIIMLICGVYIILKSNLVLSTIGIFIIVYSITDIISYILYHNSNIKK